MLPKEQKPDVTLDNITIAVNGQQLITQFNLDIASAEKIVITGQSGCGKTTLLKAILGFIIPKTGSIKIKGSNLDKHSIWQLRKHFAYVPQQPQFPQITVEDILPLPFHLNANKSLAKNLLKIPELLQAFNLDKGILKKFPQDLSGGEKQRLAFIQAILLDRDIYLLDEITSALDPKNKSTVIDYIDSIKKTVICIAHDQSIAKIAHRQINLEQPNGGRADGHA